MVEHTQKIDVERNNLMKIHWEIAAKQNSNSYNHFIIFFLLLLLILYCVDHTDECRNIHLHIETIITSARWWWCCVCMGRLRVYHCTLIFRSLPSFFRRDRKRGNKQWIIDLMALRSHAAPRTISYEHKHTNTRIHASTYTTSTPFTHINIFIECMVLDPLERTQKIH